MPARPRFQSISALAAALLLGTLASVGNAQEAIIVDHTCCDLSVIPDQWIDAAKALTIHYAHTSHGSQVNSGAENLESLGFVQAEDCDRFTKLGEDFNECVYLYPDSETTDSRVQHYSICIRYGCEP